MIALLALLFLCMVYDQRLTSEMDRDGHLSRLLHNKRLRARRTFVRSVGGLGCVLYLAWLRSQL